MVKLTSSMPFDTFNAGLGKLVGQLSSETTNMTRILSVVNYLKRVGFALLLRLQKHCGSYHL